MPDEHARRGAGAVLQGLSRAPAAAAVHGAESGGVLGAHYWDDGDEWGRMMGVIGMIVMIRSA